MIKKNIQVQLKIKGFHPYYINRVILLFLKKWRKLEWASSKLQKQVFICKKRKRFTLLRSPHVDKKARDQFESITHKRIIVLKLPLTEKSILSLYRFIKYVNNISIGVNLEIKYKNIE